MVLSMKKMKIQSKQLNTYNSTLISTQKNLEEAMEYYFPMYECYSSYGKSDPSELKRVKQE